MSRKKKATRQLSFRIEEELYAKVQEAATGKTEDLALADFARKLFEIAFKRYQEAGSLYALRILAAPAEAGARQAEIERAVVERSKPVPTRRKKDSIH